MSAPFSVRRLVWVLVLGVAVTLGLALVAQLDATLEALTRFRWRLVPLVIGAVLVNYALRFVKWHYYLRRLAIPMAPGPSLLVFLAGFTMAITPGKVGELVKAFMVRDRVGTQLSRTASVVMAERLTDIAGLIFLSALGVTALPHGGLVLGITGALLVAALVAVRTRGLADLLSRRLERTPRLRRLAEPIRLFLGAGRALATPMALALAVPLSCASWFFECLALHLVLGGLGVTLPLRAATFVYAFASLAGALSMLPGGLGVAEGSLTGFLVALGVPLADAAAATLLIRAATLWLAVALGISVVGLASRADPRLSPRSAA